MGHLSATEGAATLDEDVTSHMSSRHSIHAQNRCARGVMCGACLAIVSRLSAVKVHDAAGSGNHVRVHGKASVHQ